MGSFSSTASRVTSGRCFSFLFRTSGFENSGTLLGGVASCWKVVKTLAGLLKLWLFGSSRRCQNQPWSAVPRWAG